LKPPASRSTELNESGSQSGPLRPFFPKTTIFMPEIPFGWLSEALKIRQAQDMNICKEQQGAVYPLIW